VLEGNYVTIYEEYKHKFFQIPKVFFTSDRYINMSNNAKIAWALLRERSSVSKKNKWFDKDTKRIYFIFKNEDLMDILNISGKATVVKVKKELRDNHLIEEVRLGKNRPNKMYLLYPIVEDSDIEKIDEFDNYKHEQDEDTVSSESLATQGSSKIEPPKTLDMTGSSKIEPQEVQKLNSSYTQYSYTEYRDKRLDTLDTKDTKIAPFSESRFDNSLTEQNKKMRKEQYMENAFYENAEKIPKEIATMLQVFSNSAEQAKKYYDTILLAKRNAEITCDVVIWLESDPELEQEIVNTFSRSIRKIEKEGNVKNKNGYIYKAIYDLICNKINDHPDSDFSSEILNYNWLNE